MSTKICSTCKIKKIRSKNFRKRKIIEGSRLNGNRGFDGFYGTCINCVNARRRKWRREHPEQTKLIRRREYLVYRQYYLEKARESRNNNHEKHIQASREWRKKNPDKQRESERKWKENNPHKYRLKSERHSSKRFSQILNTMDGSITDELLLIKLKEQKFRCGICNLYLNRVEKHMDHKIPLMRGGTHTSDNVWWLCKKCNITKAGKTVEEYVLKRNS